MAKMTTPIVLSVDGENHEAMQKGDVFDTAVIPVSTSKKNLLDTDESGLVVRATDLISAQSSNIIKEGLDNKLLAELSLRYNAQTSTLDLVGANNVVVSHIQLPVIPGLPVVAEILRDIVPPAPAGSTGSPYPRGTYLHLKFVLADGGTTDIYVNVSDLVDIYSAGNGISITGNTVAVKPEEGKGIVATYKGVAVDMTDLVDGDNKIIGAVQNKVTAQLALVVDTTNSLLKLVGRNGAVVSQQALPVNTGIPTVVEFLSNFTPPPSHGADSSPLPKGSYLHLHYDPVVGEETDIYADAGSMVKNLIGTGGALGTDSSGNIVLKPADLIVSGEGLEVVNGKLRVSCAGIKPCLVNFIASSIKDGEGKFSYGLAYDPETGKLMVDFDQMPSEKMQEVFSSMIKTGGGLDVDPVTGQIFFNVQKMDKSVFQALMAELHILEWRTANLNVFVDNTHPNKSDVVRDSTGKRIEEAGTVDRPFATPQAAVNFIVDNFNLSTFNAYIYVKADTTYSGAALILPEYQTNTGAIYIHSWTGTGTYQSSNRFKIHRTTPAEGSLVKNGAICAIGGIWNVMGADADCNISQFTKNYRNAAGVVSGNGASLALQNCAARCRFTDADTINGFPSFALSGYGALALQNSTLTYSPGVGPHEIELKKNSAISRNVFFYPLYSMGDMNIYGSNYENRDANMEIDAAAFEACATATTKGSIIVSSSGTIEGQEHMNIAMKEGVTASGKCYSCTTGGSINVNGLGADYFPGSEAGTADNTTFSWYK